MAHYSSSHSEPARDMRRSIANGRDGYSHKRSTRMCDYSLHAVASRPAKVDDRLITTRFRNSVTNGLAAVCEPDVAVCLLPGTEVAFDHDAKYAHPLLWFTHRTIQETVARFR